MSREMSDWRNFWLRSICKCAEYCCNLSGGVVLNVWFTTNGICVKKNTIYMWRKQAIIKWSHQVISIVACCHSAKLFAHAARDFRSQQYYSTYRRKIWWLRLRIWCLVKWVGLEFALEKKKNNWGLKICPISFFGYSYSRRLLQLVLGI